MPKSAISSPSRTLTVRRDVAQLAKGQSLRAVEPRCLRIGIEIHGARRMHRGRAELVGNFCSCKVRAARLAALAGRSQG